MTEKQKDTFERAVAIMTYLANNAAYPIAYKQGADFWVKDAFKRVKHDFNTDFWKSVFELNNEQKFILGFRIWSNESELLIPIWIIESLPDDFDAVVESISGGRCSIKEIDKDCRAGCATYTLLKIN